MSDPKKRSLKLMNEVLPDPRPNREAAREGTPTARARTQAHMQRLLAASAAMSVAACSRSTGYGVVDPMPIPADAGAGGPGGMGGAEADSAPTTPAATVASATSMGYGVVDPMPMPACPNVAGQITATAAWTKTKGGGPAAITIHLTAKPGTYAIVFGKPNPAAPGTIVSSRVVGGSMTIVVAPDPAAATSSMFVSVGSTCDRRPFTVSLSISNLDADGGTPSVVVQAY